jgi:hypothetical protein
VGCSIPQLLTSALEIVLAAEVSGKKKQIRLYRRQYDLKEVCTLMKINQ